MDKDCHPLVLTFNTYKGLSEKEREKLHRFVLASDYAQERLVTDIQNAISRLAKMRNKDVDEQILLKEVFKKKRINLAYYRVARSHLKRAYQDYFTFRSLKENKPWFNYFLMMYYRETAQPNEAFKIFEQQQKIWDTKAGVDGDMFLLKHMFYNVAVNLHEQLHSTDSHFFKLLEQSAHYTNQHEIWQRFIEFGQAFSLNSIYGSPHGHRLHIESALLDEVSDKSNLLLQFYKMYYQVTTGKQYSLRDIEELSLFLKSNIAQFKTEDFYGLLLLVENLMISALNKGDNRYSALLLEHTKYKDEKNLISRKGFVSPVEYNNTIILALREKDVAFANQFLKKYRDLLPAEIRDDFYKITYSSILFNQKKYSDVLNLLRTCEATEGFLALSLRTMILRSMYELKQVSPLISMLDTHLKFIKRQREVSQSHKLSNIKFANYLKQIINSRLLHEQRLVKIKEKILAESGFTNKIWLLEKITELIRNAD